MKRKFYKTAALALSLSLIFASAGCTGGGQSDTSESTSQSDTSSSSSQPAQTTSSTADDIEKSLDVSTAKTITLGNTIEAQDGCADVSGNQAKITKAGTYVITGTAQNGRIVVDCDDNAPVYIALKNADLTYSGGSPLYIKKADTAYLVMLSDTENSITDTSSYTFDDTEKSEPDSAVFCKNDLTICGGGTLNISANYADAVKCKDVLTVSDTISYIGSSGGMDGMSPNGGMGHGGMKPQMR